MDRVRRRHCKDQLKLASLASGVEVALVVSASIDWGKRCPHFLAVTKISKNSNLSDQVSYQKSNPQKNFFFVRQRAISRWRRKKEGERTHLDLEMHAMSARRSLKAMFSSCGWWWRRKANLRNGNGGGGREGKNF